MKYDELSKIALSLAVKVLVKAVGVYDLAQLRDMQGVIIAEFLPMLRAPAPVDDKALAEAIKYTQYLSAQGGCEPAPWGPHKQVQLETILAALRSAQLEVAELRRILGISDVWPLPDVLAKLCDAVRHMKEAHHCDTDGHEQFYHALEAGEKLLALMKASAAAKESRVSANNDELTEALAFADNLAEKVPFLPSATLAQAVRDLRKQITELRKDEERLDWVSRLFENCPHAEIHFNDDPDQDYWPVGYTIFVDGCEPLKVTAPSLREVIDRARAAGEGKGAT